MAILALHHAQVFYRAGEEPAARRFYVDTLGLREVEKPESLKANGGMWFEAPNGGQVHLSIESDLALHPRRHFAFRVDDVDRTRRQLAAAGVRTEEASEITGWKRFYAFDPFGNKIELDEIPPG